jgi:hypothetical protein
MSGSFPTTVSEAPCPRYILRVSRLVPVGEGGGEPPYDSVAFYGMA